MLLNVTLILECLQNWTNQYPSLTIWKKEKDYYVNNFSASFCVSHDRNITITSSSRKANISISNVKSFFSINISSDYIIWSNVRELLCFKILFVMTYMNNLMYFNLEKILTKNMFGVKSNCLQLGIMRLWPEKWIMGLRVAAIV